MLRTDPYTGKPHGFVPHRGSGTLHTNSAEGLEARIARLVRGALKGVRVGERGKPDDPRQIVADLVSDDASPFTPDDMHALSALTPDALIALRDTYIKPKPDEEEEITTNAADVAEIACMTAGQSAIMHKNEVRYHANRKLRAPLPTIKVAAADDDPVIKAMLAGQARVDAQRESERDRRRRHSGLVP